MFVVLPVLVVLAVMAPEVVQRGLDLVARDDPVMVRVDLVQLLDQPIRKPGRERRDRDGVVMHAVEAVEDLQLVLEVMLVSMTVSLVAIAVLVAVPIGIGAGLAGAVDARER